MGEEKEKGLQGCHTLQANSDSAGEEKQVRALMRFDSRLPHLQTHYSDTPTGRNGERTPFILLSVNGEVNVTGAVRRVCGLHKEPSTFSRHGEAQSWRHQPSEDLVFQPLPHACSLPKNVNP